MIMSTSGRSSTESSVLAHESISEEGRGGVSSRGIRQCVVAVAGFGGRLSEAGGGGSISDGLMMSVECVGDRARVRPEDRKKEQLFPRVSGN